MDICSINANLDKLILMLSSVSGKFDVIILSETWMYIEFNKIMASQFLLKIILSS